jgi:hypothetical protein
MLAHGHAPSSACVLASGPTVPSPAHASAARRGQSPAGNRGEEEVKDKADGWDQDVIERAKKEKCAGCWAVLLSRPNGPARPVGWF